MKPEVAKLIILANIQKMADYCIPGSNGRMKLAKPSWSNGPSDGRPFPLGPGP